jgi:xanthine dehydrogenase large subunit
VIYGSKAVGEPPLMLAFSAREALREAVAAFGSPGASVDLASPATPEAVFWAIERARQMADHRSDEPSGGRTLAPTEG